MMGVRRQMPRNLVTCKKIYSATFFIASSHVMNCSIYVDMIIPTSTNTPVSALNCTKAQTE